MEQQAKLLENEELMDTKDFRIKVRESLWKRLEQESDVLVLGEVGSRSFKGVYDNLSDMDFICIASEKIHDTSEKRKERSKELFSIIKETLESNCAAIEFEHEYLWDFDVFHMIYRFENTDDSPIPPTLLIDFGIMFEEQLWKPFTTPEQHGMSVIFFDKENLTSSPPDFDVEGHVTRMEADLKNTISKFGIFQSFIGKEYFRNHFLGAWDYYQEYTLAPLIKVLHMKYEPLRYFFGLRYVHHFGYPKELEETLQSLYFLGNPQEILEKQKLAIKLFYETVEELQKLDFKQIVSELSKQIRENK